MQPRLKTSILNVYIIPLREIDLELNVMVVKDEVRMTHLARGWGGVKVDNI